MQLREFVWVLRVNPFLLIFATYKSKISSDLFQILFESLKISPKFTLPGLREKLWIFSSKDDKNSTFSGNSNFT